MYYIACYIDFIIERKTKISVPQKVIWYNPTRPDLTRPDPTRYDTTRSDPTRPDPTRHNTTRSDPTRPDTTRHNTTVVNTGHTPRQCLRAGCGRLAQSLEPAWKHLGLIYSDYNLSIQQCLFVGWEEITVEKVQFPSSKLPSRRVTLLPCKQRLSLGWQFRIGSFFLF